MTQSLFDYSQGTDVIAWGRAATRNWINDGGLGRGDLGTACE
jgi:hypothetical protein